MKTIKKISQLFILLSGLLIITNTGCKKYPEGPAVSLTSKTERVANTWRVDYYLINGKDYTSSVTNYTETFTKNGNYYYSAGSVTGSGNWNFQNNENEIRINGISHMSSETLFILKLKENDFWYYYVDGNDRIEFHLIPQ